MLPFLIVSPPAVFWALLTIHDQPRMLAWAVALVVALPLLGLALPWRRLPRWTEGAIPIASLGIIMLLNVAAGSKTSGFGQLAMLPLFWIALYGTRGELVVTVVGIFAIFLLPVLFEEIHFASAVRSATLWALVAGSVGFTTQVLVRRLNSNYERTRGITESAHEAFIGMDDAGYITDWNPAAERMFGWPGAEVIGSNLADTLIPKHYREAHRIGLERFKQKGEGRVVDQRLELTALHRDGRELPIEITISATQIDGDYHFHAFLHDISRRRANEDAQRHYASQLERVNEDLQASDEMKNHFLAMASHELRTPLTAISGFSSTMLSMWEKLPDEEKHRFVGIIDQQAARLARLVSDLLTLSRIEGGKLETRPLDINLAESIEETLRELDVTQVQVACIATERAFADPDHLRQILVNYISNACKYGSAPIAVAVERDGDWVRVEVRDAGAGVPDEFVPHLFERFTQALSPGNLPVEGTGLGLSIVKGFAQAQGGDAWYEPNQPCGSCFGVHLPATSPVVAG